jgi:hypothetical protein
MSGAGCTSRVGVASLSVFFPTAPAARGAPRERNKLWGVDTSRPPALAVDAETANKGADTNSTTTWRHVTSVRVHWGKGAVVTPIASA